MEIGELIRDMVAIEGGRWVDKTEIPGLRDFRVKVRGLHSKAYRDRVAELERGGASADDAVAQVIADWVLVEIDGLTANGKPVKADSIRDKLKTEAYMPLGRLIIDAAAVVADTREAKKAQAVKN